ncbi:MAG: CRISPR-associated helicase Cas3' [Chloroflexi bacterium]|nr:CRISPR-associated helicase Cas3' [Chloroflexota bacterium]
MNLWKLWGKTMTREVPPEERQVHPLLCHMIDVAEVTGVLWERCLGAHCRQHVCSALGCDDEAARRTIMFWAALHDLGKASPSFQRRHAPAISSLKAEGLSFERQIGGTQPAYHGLISAWALPLFFQQEMGLARRLASDLAKALGGHHGGWPPPKVLQSLNSDDTGDATWDAARAELCEALRALYAPATLQSQMSNRLEWQALVTLLGGLVSVADWIGSMSEHFEPASPSSASAYAAHAQDIARRVIRDLQWDAWQAPQTPATFEQIFPFKPNEMQQTIIDLTPELNGPSLVLIEAPTGSGKTEAALYLADWWAHRLGQRGMYVAMPTTATSNAMHGRVVKMLNQRYRARQVAPLLVHGQARWTRSPSPVETEAEEGDDQAEDSEAMGWFLPRKRSLLAPFGVGTVDQALLSVLLTRHFFVRLFGLAHKTIIFDEVHAYDTYMSTLFCRLLSWLRAEGCSVVMLSATLPTSTRRAFLAAYGAREAPAELDAPYPRVTWVTGNGSKPGGSQSVRAGCQALLAPDNRELALHWHPHDDQALAATLRDALADGGCAAVLCNTVRRAQEVYQALREAAIVPDDDLILFHARYPQAWRAEIEDKVLGRFGKNATPAIRRGIVVAPQVIEQSLDLDFDLMVTDLAPVDLILQRAGRLHRHMRPDRPARLREPRLMLIEPRSADDLPEWGSDAFVYEAYILRRTWLVLRGLNQLVLPSQTQALIEAVYDVDKLPVELSPDDPQAQALCKDRAEWERNRSEHSKQARKRLVLPPGDEDLMAQRNAEYAEDAPGVHESMQALTRLSEPSITVVCLHQTPYGLTLEPEGGRPIDLYQKPWAELTAELVQHSVSISHSYLVRWLAKQEVPVGWREHPLLRYDRPAIFDGGVCRLEGTGYRLTLSRELGLQIEKEDA